VRKYASTCSARPPEGGVLWFGPRRVRESTPVALPGMLARSRPLLPDRSPAALARGSKASTLRPGCPTSDTTFGLERLSSGERCSLGAWVCNDILAEGGPDLHFPQHLANFAELRGG
jgi:hypothetical protein